MNNKVKIIQGNLANHIGDLIKIEPVENTILAYIEMGDECIVTTKLTNLEEYSHLEIIPQGFNTMEMPSGDRIVPIDQLEFVEDPEYITDSNGNVYDKEYFDDVVFELNLSPTSNAELVYYPPNNEFICSIKSFNDITKDWGLVGRTKFTKETLEHMENLIKDMKEKIKN